jgi:hypothetical protein
MSLNKTRNIVNLLKNSYKTVFKASNLILTSKCYINTNTEQLKGLNPDKYNRVYININNYITISLSFSFSSDY